MRTTQLTNRRLDLRRDLPRLVMRPMRPIRQPGQPLGLIPTHPGMHRLA
jgi:hypothetical protein